MSLKSKLKSDLEHQEKYKSRRIEQQKKVLESLKVKLDLEVNYGDKWLVSKDIKSITINPNTQTWLDPVAKKRFKYKSINNLIHSKFGPG